jgi:glycosyltransferase involved in cell wall biosynthesis
VNARVHRWASRLRRHDAPEAPIARVALNMRPPTSAWGGGGQWVAQMVRYLADRRYAVSFDLDSHPDLIVMVDPRPGGLVTFGPADIARYREGKPSVRVIHRVNENDARKGTHDVDRLLADANRVADETVFVSAWLRDYHAARWFDIRRPHAVIGNAADPRIFHPIGGAAFRADGRLRLVTHHWSDNWGKGFAVYQELDRLIADGALPGTDLHVIGRWPREISWRAARAIPPAHGHALAALLRECHAYVTASLWEPGGMHFVEGAQCGLPVIYHEDGGGTPEVVAPFGVGFKDDVRAAVVALRDRYADLRATLLARPPSGDVMCGVYAQLIQRVVASTGAAP